MSTPDIDNHRFLRQFHSWERGTCNGVSRSYAAPLHRDTAALDWRYMKRSTTRLQRPTQRIRRTSRAPDLPAYEHNADDLMANRFLALGPIEQALQIRSGFDAPILEDIASKLLHIPLRELLASLRMPRDAIIQKIRLGMRLTTSESDHVARIFLIYGQAGEVLEDAELAATWLLRSNIELGGERPLNMMDTQPGFDRVRDLLLRIERGVGL